MNHSPSKEAVAGVGYFEAGGTVVRRALRVLEDTDTALVTACRPGAEARWPSLYTKARTDGDRSARIEAFDTMATGEWDLEAGLWQDTELVCRGRWVSRVE
ncbi:hypothetical protein [Streptomyces violaceusniger]|uniref:Uncharacterized protein n=1 Tax=Streptomyces violaceusniger (strain Tu 4113) TaxID=653045 RepID=G2PGY2_STRV4|nr:hypothetical protein [Streptomyces violaceusniger]AEM88696.1 hypothetical protein Strvi_9442 [Streptomyces violaceusniger Tu 4113]